MLRVDIYLFNDMQGGWVIYSNLFYFYFFGFFIRDSVAADRYSISQQIKKLVPFVLFFSFANKRRSAVYRVGTRDRM
jgi:hypothetical protein